MCSGQQTLLPGLEVKIETIYLDGNKSTHFHALRDGARVFSRVIKYAAASLASTAVDYALYILFHALGLNVALSFALARAVSAALNYAVNCRAVFRMRPSAANALANRCIFRHGATEFITGRARGGGRP